MTRSRPRQPRAVPGTRKTRGRRGGHQTARCRSCGPSGVKFNPSMVSGDVLAYIRKDGDERAFTIRTSGAVRQARFARRPGRPMGRRSSSQASAFERNPGSDWSRHPEYELTLTSGGPSFSPTGDRFAFVGPAENAKGAGVAVASVAVRRRKSSIRIRRATCSDRSGHRTANTSSSASVCSMHSSTDSTVSSCGRRSGRRRAQVAMSIPMAGVPPVRAGRTTTLPVDVAGRRRFVYRTFGRRATVFGSWTSRRTGDIDRGRVRQLSIVVAARRPDHVLASGETAITRIYAVSPMAQVSSG